MVWLTAGYRTRAAAGHPAALADGREWASPALACAIYLTVSGVIGSEFLPHLDEGALWVRGTLAPSTGPDRRHPAGESGAAFCCARFPK